MKHSKITSKNVEEVIGVKEARARRILKEMMDKNYIAKQGQSRSTCYVLKSETI